MGYSENRGIYEAVNRRELYRYLGYGKQAPDETVHMLIDEVLTELTQMMEPKSIYKVYDCNTEDKVVKLYHTKSEKAAFMIHSRNLAENLHQCRRVVLMAATLGVGVDKLLNKYEIINMAKASIAQACGAACIEAYCNIVQEDIRQQAAAQGLYLRPRFSPGYGDLPLETQRDIFGQLECTKRIGLTLTQSLLMIPTKSVTAFIGITKNEKGCHIGKCVYCDKMDCEFRNC